MDTPQIEILGRRRLAIAMSVVLVAAAIWAWPKVHFLTTEHISHQHDDGTVSTWCVVKPIVWRGFGRIDEDGNFVPDPVPEHSYRRHGWSTYPDGARKWFNGREHYEMKPLPDGSWLESKESVQSRAALRGHLPD